MTTLDLRATGGTLRLARNGGTATVRSFLVAGPTGPQGPVGPPGIAGPTGAAGPASTVAGPVGPQGLPGTNAVPADNAVAGYVAGPSATLTALLAVVARKTLAPLEGARAYSYGDSYGNNANGSSADVVTAFPYRVCARQRTQALIDRSISGTRTDQIQNRIQTTWTAPGMGVVFLPDVVLNDVLHGNDINTCREGFRSILTYLTARYIAPITDPSLQFGPGWSAGVSSTVGSYVDIAFNGDVVNVLYNAVAATAGQFTATDSAGTVRATVNVSGYANPFTGVTRLSGFGAGDHTIRVAVTSGSVGIVGSAVPSVSPPLVVWFKPGGIVQSAGTNNPQIAAYLAECSTILGNFPTVVPVATDGSFNTSTMIYTDQIHLNDIGNAYVADLIEKALAGQSFVQGLNSLAALPTYTAPAATYTRPGATVPAAPTGLAVTRTNQVTASWTPAADGGATITGYIVESSPTGVNTWTTAGTAARTGTSLQINSGLTPNSVYDFRVRAVNSVGNGTPSSTVTQTAGAVFNGIWTEDALTGTGAMGVATTNGQSWNNATGTTFTRTATGAQPTTVATSGNGSCVVDDGQTDGTFTLTLAGTGGNKGLLFNGNTAQTNGYIFWADGADSNKYKLTKRTTATGFALVVASTTTWTDGDVLTVVKAGSSITCKINGTTVLTTTDPTYTGTSHGLWAYNAAAGGTFKSWQHKQ